MTEPSTRRSLETTAGKGGQDAPTLLLLDDDPRVIERVGGAHLDRDPPFAVTTGSDRAAAEAAIASGDVDCVVSEYRLPNFDGLALLEKIRETDPDLPFILFTDGGSEAVASRAIAAGVTDYVRKDGTAATCRAVCDRASSAIAEHREAGGLPASEVHLRDVLSHISESVFVVDDRFELLYASDAFEDVYGLPGDAIDADPMAIRERVHPADRRFVEDWLAEMKETVPTAAGDGGSTVEFRYDHPDRGERWLEASLHPVVDDGTVVRYVGIGRDLTNVKRSHEELRRSEAKFRGIAEASDDLLFRIDTAGAVTYASPALESVLGYAPADVEGEHFLEFIVDDYRETAVEEYLSVLEGGSTDEIELVLEHAEGRPVILEVNTTPIEDDGEVVAAQGVGRDVTERKERERELEQYETIVETVPDGVFVVDAEGTIVGGNARAADVMGYAQEHLLGRPFTYLVDEGVVPPESIETYLDTVRELLSADSPRERARYQLDATVDGERRNLEVHLALRPFDEEFRGVIGVLRDVSERHAYQDRLERQNERLERFASVLSHDLRNPLNVAIGRVKLARQERDSAHLEAVERAHARMNELCTDVLSMAKQGRTIEDQTETDLATTARAAWATATTDEARLEVASGPGAVVADGSRLRQLLENLFRNSVEHGGRDVTVTVGALPDGTGFFVADDGPGVDPDDVATVFDYGYSTTDSTGLGLAIVSEIVDAHGWRVSVGESASGGARFEVRTDDEPSTAGTG